ncbi:FkbM family methyltransferase [Capillimicrobium parvum]|uniref:Methyltransferase FkbM domain-containing protein n=1 Tax=Capillimicrobium parvum TaxID=2884022 RepID=A0A9E7C2U2_9ACTN|nr:FkbM family methyltransferase [Capillimicrobium parvum]UGS38806.1 hypothetical protein DSM104329_05236 [Capillimicrobium parvum]
MAVKSYSQVGEDLQIAYFIGRGADVRYIDVGCLWPVQHSNSYYFYERGGSGLCIDPNPTVGDEYRETRPRDVFVNCGIGAEAGMMTYVMHENPVFNTFSTQRAAEVARKAEKRPGGRTMTGTVEVAIKPLAQVVAETGFAERVEGRVDFLSIDVEGFELDVIRGFDFGVLRPKLIVTEHLRGKADAVEDAEIVKVMAGHGYWVGGYTGHDLYFLDERA